MSHAKSTLCKNHWFFFFLDFKKKKTMNFAKCWFRMRHRQTNNEKTLKFSSVSWKITILQKSLFFFVFFFLGNPCPLGLKVRRCHRVGRKNLESWLGHWDSLPSTENVMETESVGLVGGTELKRKIELVLNFILSCPPANHFRAQGQHCDRKQTTREATRKACP